MQRRKVEGIVEGSTLLDDSPHRYVWFPSVSLTRAQLVKIPEEVLSEVGVDLTPGTQSIIEAEVNVDAIAPGFVNPINLQNLGILPSLDSELTFGS